ncbi:PD-(D/E)XK nuclease family protein [Patescibacteria group bacterium]|nr:PD-(D/E)XK nuclease family protein [Patescibacteria group bacterium]MBU4466642.1 PD-(D/E)XK nuclease family protein [Patescibacteria group bacterium]
MPSLVNKTKTISAKDLGKLALLDFCPRCFWLERHFGKPPSIFPSIFSIIDSLTKKSVQTAFSQTEKLPAWLELDNVSEVEGNDFLFKLPVDEGWILIGYPDDIFKLEDNSYHIVDYKTAKFTDRQDELFPMYKVQLNAYAFLAEKYGLKPVSKLSLVYCQPKEELENCQEFKLSFDIYQLAVELDLEMVGYLLKKAREIVSLTEPPVPAHNCKGICEWLEKIINRPNSEVDALLKPGQRHGI